MNENIASLIDELYELDIRNIVLSPGARTTPLSTLFCAYEKFNVYMNLDERSAGFFALGIAKEQNKPVVLVCTSGSALAHYFPAVIEAEYSQIPLIILTADRPAEAQNIGAAQTIEQRMFFGSHIKFQAELGKVDYEKSFAYARLMAQNAYLHAQTTPKGVAHINIPLDEPLLPSFDSKLFSKAKNQGFKLTLPNYVVDFDFNPLFGKKGVFICAAGSADYSHEDRQAILSLAEKLNIPLLADPLSQMRFFESDTIIDTYDIFLKDGLIAKELQPDYICLFGQSPISKRLQAFIKDQNIPCYQINEADVYRNSAANTSHFVQTTMGNWARQFDKATSKNKDFSYLKLWQNIQKKTLLKLNSLDPKKDFFEGSIVSLLQKNILPNTNLCLGNSMTIRDIDYFWRTKEQNIKFFCNRGANGIDGTISTALGLATQNPTVLLSGDLSFWHDLNGLLIGKTHKINLTIILINNDGGGIFQYLPFNNCNNFDYIFRTPHGMDFSALQTLYGLNYYEIKSALDFENIFTEVQKNHGMNLLEIKISMEESFKLHEKYTKV